MEAFLMVVAALVLLFAFAMCKVAGREDDWAEKQYSEFLASRADNDVTE